MESTVWMPQNTEGGMHANLPKFILGSFSYSGWTFRLQQRSKICVYLEELFNSLEWLWKCPGLRHATSSLIKVITWGTIPTLLKLISPMLMIDLPRMHPLRDDSWAKTSVRQLTCVPQTSKQCGVPSVGLLSSHSSTCIELSWPKFRPYFLTSNTV